MKLNNIFYLILGVLITAILTSCNPDDPEDINPEEVITTLTYTLTSQSGGPTAVLKFQDLDGDGGNAPTITADNLQANTTYSGTLELLNESETPSEDITEEIEEEDEEHQFFFSTTVAGLGIAYNDLDDDGNPIGLETTVTTGAAGTGTVTVILRHEPAKSASGVADGDITNAGGETDIEVTFDIEVE